MEQRVSIWEQEDQPHVRDYGMAIVFATVFPIARLLLDSLVFEVKQKAFSQIHFHRAEEDTTIMQFQYC